MSCAEEGQDPENQWVESIAVVVGVVGVEGEEPLET